VESTFFIHRNSCNARQSLDFVNPFIGQLVSGGTKGKDPDVKGLNFMLAVIDGSRPKDEITAVHMATMTFARRLNHVDNIPQQDSTERAFNKLTRTFTTQMEALKR
jgi:hypothetical protein